MAGKWRQLAPHFLAMFVLYFIAFQALYLAFDIRSFWVSLAIALAVAIIYPMLVRSLGLEPEVWERETS